MYKKFDQSIKDIVIKTQNINAFPDLEIPRTTALYWIKRSKRKITKNKNMKDIVYAELKNNRTLLEVEKSKVMFLRKMLEIERRQVTKEKKDLEIIESIHSFKKVISIRMLSLLSGLAESKYYQLKGEKSLKNFRQTKSNQLTVNEQKTLLRLAQCKSLSHLSIKQLQLYAFRENILHCHYDTWRKYIKKFGIDNQRKRQYVKKKRILYQASSPGQVWHIDLTYFKGPDKTYLYLQVIMDSYSRTVMSWVLKKKRDTHTTITNLIQATEKTRPKVLISDAGSENMNFKVKNFLITKDISHIVAQNRTSFSNARIEAFFNTLKSRYINKYKTYTQKELFDVINKAIRLYNNSPSAIFFGATPLEVLKNKNIYHSLSVEIKRKMEYAKVQRRNIYKEGVYNS